MHRNIITGFIVDSGVYFWRNGIPFPQFCYRVPERQCNVNCIHFGDIPVEHQDSITICKESMNYTLERFNDLRLFELEHEEKLSLITDILTVIKQFNDYKVAVCHFCSLSEPIHAINCIKRLSSTLSNKKPKDLLKNGEGRITVLKAIKIIYDIHLLEKKDDICVFCSSQVGHTIGCIKKIADGLMSEKLKDIELLVSY